MTQRRILLILTVLFAVSCSPEASKQYLVPTYQKGPKVTSKGKVNYTGGKVDILFVIDNSGSMGSHQTTLSNNINVFINDFSQTSLLDYHIGVVTTDVDRCSSTVLIAGECGLLYGTPKFVDNKTPNLISVLKKNLMPGTDGSAEEKSFDPIENALSLVNTKGFNKGFYRSSAYLAIIFITDTEDQSDQTEKEIYAKLLALKKNDPRKVLGYGVFIPTKEMSKCYGESMVPTKLEGFLNLVVNAKAAVNQFSLCDPDFGKRLSEIGQNIINQTSTVYYLKDLPDIDTIQVTYGSLVLPRDVKMGWSYDSALNAVTLGAEVDWLSQPVGSKLNVTYDLADPAAK